MGGSRKKSVVTQSTTFSTPVSTEIGEINVGVTGEQIAGLLETQTIALANLAGERANQEKESSDKAADTKENLTKAALFASAAAGAFLIARTI